MATAPPAEPTGRCRPRRRWRPCWCGRRPRGRRCRRPRPARRPSAADVDVAGGQALGGVTASRAGHAGGLPPPRPVPGRTVTLAEPDAGARDADARRRCRRPGCRRRRSAPQASMAPATLTSPPDADRDDAGRARPRRRRAPMGVAASGSTEMPPPTATPVPPMSCDRAPGAVMPSVTTEPALAVRSTSPSTRWCRRPTVLMAPPIETLRAVSVSVPPGRDAAPAAGPIRLMFCSITIGGRRRDA